MQKLFQWLMVCAALAFVLGFAFCAFGQGIFGDGSQSAKFTALAVSGKVIADANGVSGTNLTAGSVNSNKLDAATLAILNLAGSGGTIANGSVNSNKLDAATLALLGIANGSVNSNKLDAATVAMFAPAGFTTLYAAGSAATLNPSSGVAYHIGANANQAPMSNPMLCKLFVPKTGSIKACAVFVRDGGTSGSGETVTYSITNLTQATASATWTGTISTAAVYAESTTLNFAVTAGDYIAVRILTPTWATPPTSVTATAEIFVQ